VNCYVRKCPPIPPGSTARHCAACHQTFSSLTLFDRHQDWQACPRKLSCESAEAMGLVQAGNQTWWTPEGLKKSTERVGMMLQARKAAA
jgi:hypothetical protein